MIQQSTQYYHDQAKYANIAMFLEILYIVVVRCYDIVVMLAPTETRLHSLSSESVDSLCTQQNDIVVLTKTIVT